MKRGSSAALVALLVLSAIWGYNWVVIKIATHEADAFTVAALRCTFGTLFLFLALIATRRPLRSPAVVPTIVLGLLQTTLFTLLQTLAVAGGGAGKTAILVYTMPFWTVLLALAFLHERVRAHGWIALGLAAGGLGLVLWPIDFSSGLTSKLFALAAALAWAASAVYAKRLRARHSIELLSLTTWQFLYGTIPLLGVWLFAPNKHLALTPSFFLALAYLAIPASAGAWLLWLFVLSRLRAGVAGIASLLTPVVGVIAAWLQLGERPGTLEILGMGMIVAALVVNALPARVNAAIRAENA